MSLDSKKYSAELIFYLNFVFGQAWNTQGFLTPDSFHSTSLASWGSGWGSKEVKFIKEFHFLGFSRCFSARNEKSSKTSKIQPNSSFFWFSTNASGPPKNFRCPIFQFFEKTSKPAVWDLANIKRNKVRNFHYDSPDLVADGFTEAISVGTSDPNFGSTQYFWPEFRGFLGQGLEELSKFGFFLVKGLMLL